MISLDRGPGFNRQDPGPPHKNMKTIIVIIFCFVFAFKVQNNLDERAYYLLFWVDHSVEQIIGPMRVAGGEVDSKSSMKIRHYNQPGHYIFWWWNKDKSLEFERRVEVVPGVVSDVVFELNYPEIEIEVSQ